MGKWDACKKNMKKNNPTGWVKFTKQRKADKAKAYLNMGKIPLTAEKKMEIKKEKAE
jgi:hypothetical protein